MRSNRGVTLVSVVVYVIGMVIMASLIATLTSFFYKNVDVKSINSGVSTQFTDFSEFFSYEVNLKGNRVVDCKTIDTGNNKESYIIFSNGDQFTYKSENKCVYKNQYKVCVEVEDCDFSYEFVDSEYKINVNFKTNKLDFTGNNSMVYYLKL